MGKALAFFGFIWLVTCIAGGIMLGSVPVVSTHLTAVISATDTTITVSDTTGFSAPGILVVENERVAYSSTSATTFTGNLARPLRRGASGTTGVAHSSGTAVRTVESALLNNSIDYNLAVLSDASGLMAFVSMPLACFDIIKTFAATPFQFLGTNLQILTAIWGIAFLGLIVSFFLAIAGGRRV